MKRADDAADRLLERARDDQDIEASRLLKHLGRVHDVAMEVVRANTHQQAKAAYDELVDIFNGRER